MKRILSILFLFLLTAVPSLLLMFSHQQSSNMGQKRIPAAHPQLTGNPPMSAYSYSSEVYTK